MPFHFESDGIHLYGSPADYPAVSNGEPANLMFLTSVRDVGGDDHNGDMVRLRDGGRVYMEGIVERTIAETREGGALHGIARVVGIVTDDLPRDMRRLPYPVRPVPDRLWIHPSHLRTEEGDLVASEDFTHWIPSRFRQLPQQAVDERSEQKEEFERSVLTVMRQRRADVLISDHYMARIAYMIRNGLFGRILNIHPAITVPGHPYAFPGKTPTADAIARAQRQRTFTGATLHVIDELIDHGQPVAFAATTPVYASDREHPMDLRYRNYQGAKIPVFIEGIRWYLEHLFPRLPALQSHLRERTLPLLDRVAV